MLVARLDNAGDVLLQGPLVRAVAAGADRVVFLAGPAGRRGRRGCCPASTRCVTWSTARGSSPTRRRSTPPTLAALADAGRARSASDEAVVSHLVPPVAAAAGAGAAHRRGARGSARSASTTPARCSTSGTGWTTTCPSPSAPSRWPARPASSCRRGDDGRLAVRRPLPAGRPRARATSSLHPGASVPARAWPAERCARGGRGAGRRRAPGAGHRRPGRARRSPRSSPAPAAWTSAARPRWPQMAALLDGAAARRRRQHRPGAPGRRGRHPRRLAVLPGRPGGAVGALRRAHRAAGRPERGLPGHPGPGVPGARPPLPDVGEPGRRRRRRREAGDAAMKVLLWHVHGSWTTAFVAGPRTSTCCRSLPDRGPDGLGRARTWDWPAVGPGGRPRTQLRDERRRRRRPAADARPGAGPRVAGPRARPRPARRVPRAQRARRRRAGHPAPAGRPRTTSRSRTSPTSTELFYDNGRAPTTVIEHGIVDPGRAVHRASWPAPPSWSTSRSAAAGTPAPTCCRGWPRSRRSTSSAWGWPALHERVRPGPGRVALHDDPPQAAMHAELARRRVYVHPVPLDLARAVAARGDAPGHAGGRAGRHRGGRRRCRPRPGCSPPARSGWRPPSGTSCTTRTPPGWPARPPAPRRWSATAWPGSSPTGTGCSRR